MRAPDEVRAWVEQRYLPILTAACRRAVGDATRVELVEAEWQDTPAAGDRTALALGDLPRGAVADGTRLNPKYTFEQFVICDANRLAHGAALAVAELPGQAYNPLLLHGRPGVGKSHLLHAIGNYAQLHGDGLRVRYATVESFTSDFVGAVRRRDTGDFRERFRAVDLLLLDDVQFLTGKAGTTEELFHTFNALADSGSQLVLTSDCHPHELPELEERLAERLASGLVAELDPPDLAARLAILRKRAALDPIGELDEATLAEIARRVPRSVRALESALIQVVAYASLRGEPSSPALAARVLERLGGAEAGGRPSPTIDGVQAATAERFGLTKQALLAADRRPRVALARQVAMYLTRELTDESLPAIGRSFGGRNHSTVLHACRRVERAIEREGEARDAVHNLRNTLRP